MEFLLLQLLAVIALYWWVISLCAKNSIVPRCPCIASTMRAAQKKAQCVVWFAELKAIVRVQSNFIKLRVVAVYLTIKPFIVI